MRKTDFLNVILLSLLASLFFTNCTSTSQKTKQLEITYPFNHALFPADITAPSVVWTDENEENKKWQVLVSVSGKEIVKTETSSTNWKLSETQWENIKKSAKGQEIKIEVKGFKNNKEGESVLIQVSEDKVEAPIFFRAVPLPFKFARENLKEVRWHLGSVAETSKPHAVLDNIPVCANCHSFTPDGATVAMDVDARDDKGAYAISALQKETLFAEDSIIHWSDNQDGKFTYGLLSQISPDGRYVVSTLRDCEIFADRKDLEYSQLFFPFKGILVVYDRIQKKYFELEGANDTTSVHSNPCWTPDGKYIYFTKTQAKHYCESGIHNGSVPRNEDYNIYEVFEKQYMDRDSLMKFDIYRIPFNNGKGGEAEPVKGASNNGFSNYFPKISPDGKWLVFCQAESFMLLQKDSKLTIVPVEGGEARQMTCNTSNMNSWHSWSPNGKWLVFSTKEFSPYTQLFLTHINPDGTDTPPVYLENFSFDKYAVNIPEFVNIKYDKELRINPTFLAENDFIIRNGEIKLKDGDLDGAFLDFNRAIEKFPKNSEPYYQRARIYFQKNNYNEALNDFNTAIQIDKLAHYLLSRGITFMKMNRPEKAIKDLSESTELDPGNSSPWCYLGVLYTGLNNYSEALNHLNKAIELYDGDAYAFYYRGLVNFTLKNWKNADDDLTKAVNLIPDKSIKPLVYELRGKARYNLGNYSGVINDASITIKLSPKDPAPVVLKGKAELGLGLKKEALNSFNQAKRMGSREADILIQKNS